MKMRTALIPLCVLALVAMVWLPAAFSQDDITSLSDGAFESPQRPASAFVHDEHNEKAELEDSCNLCHHMYEDGVRLEDDDSIGIPCSDCHMLEAQGDQPGLRLAYHRQCKGCHVDRAMGPVACGECHQK